MKTEGRTPKGVPAAVVLLAVLACLLSAHLPLMRAQGGGTVTVTFDSPVPPGSPSSLLEGIFQGIAFGTGQWRWQGPFDVDPTNHIQFASSAGNSRSFSFSPAPQLLNSVVVFSLRPGTLNLSDNLGQVRSQSISTGFLHVVKTGWTQASTTVTVNFTGGWALGLDDITYGGTASPPDTTPPTVLIASPAEGATVSGNTTVSAAASDDVDVVGVQFLLDGVNLGAEDTVPPFSISWDTASADNGGHALSARARDVAGNTGTAPSINVTVSNTADPVQVGQWEGPFNWPLAPVHVHLLRTGEVLMWDEESGGLSARLWNPSTSTFTAVPNNSSNLFGSGHSFLGDGRLLVTGGHTGAFSGIPDVNIFDPGTSAWALSTPMASSRKYPTAITLPDGRVLVLSGLTTCEACIANTPEIFDPVASTWTQLGGATMALPLHPYSMLLSDGRVAEVGSDQDSAVTHALEIPAQTWARVDPVLLESGSAALYRPRKIVASGRYADPAAAAVSSLSNTWVLDLTQPAPAWRETASMVSPRAFHTLTLLPDGTVLATGGSRRTDGQDTSQAVSEAELWNPGTETWTKMARMQRPRLFQSTALLLPDGRVLVAGGYRPPYVEQTAEVYSPPYLFKGARPTITSVPGTINYGTPFFLETPNAASVGQVTLLGAGSMMRTFNGGQRFLELSFQVTTGGLTVQAPANGSLAPPGYYLLFILNTNGIPSVGSFVRVAASPVFPSVRITTPASGSTVSGMVTVTAEASDDTGVAGVQFRVDGANSGPEDIIFPYSMGLDTVGLTNGLHVLTAVARDTDGNQTTSADVLITVSNPSDTSPPTVAITSPASGATLSGIVRILAEATDDVGVVGVQFLLNGGNLGAEDTVAPYSFDWDTTTVVNGSYNLSARARDAAGNQTTSSAVNVTVANGVVRTGFSLRFFGNGVNDIDRVKIQIDDPTNNNPGPPADVGATDFTIEFWMRANASENPAPAVSCGSTYGWITGNIVFDRDRFAQGRAFGISIGNGRFAFGINGDGTGTTTICGTTNVLDGQWHHVAVQRRRSDGWMWLFVDGNLGAQADGPDGDVSYPDDGVPGNFCGGPCTNSDPYLVIGAEKHDVGPASYPPYSGWVDEVRLSNTLRYAGNFTRPTQPFTPDANTVGLYHLDEGAGDVITDTSGAPGGPSNGVRRFGGSPAGPVWSTETPFPAAALSFYVRKGATGSNTGTDWNSAWTDFDAVNWSLLGTGDTLWIAGGTYTRSLLVNAGGSAGSPLFIKRATVSDHGTDVGWQSSFDAQVVLTGFGLQVNRSFVTVDGRTISGIRMYDGAPHIVRIQAVNNVTLRYLEIEMNRANPNSEDAIQGAGNNFLAEYLRIVNAYDHAGQHSDCIQWYWGRSFIVRYSIFRNCGQHMILGAEVFGPSYVVNDIAIYYNLFFNDSGLFEGQNAYNGINFQQVTATSSDFLRIDNNVFALRESEYSQNGFRHVFFYSTGFGNRSNHFFRNNIVRDSGEGDIASIPDGRRRNNCYFANDWSPPAETGPVLADPLFVNYAGNDFHLQSSSPNINAGFNVSLTQDLDGNAVPQGGVPDIGAFEAPAPLSPPPDAVAPSVALTAPPQGATVSGTVTMAATASDNVAVAQVQFLLDSAPLGAPDTTAPYEFPWNTVGATNGNHTLGARATDTASNQATSSAVTVIVQNAQTGTGLVNDTFITGLDQPVRAVFTPDGRMLVVERTGRGRLVQPGSTQVDPTPFLQITNLNVDGERGFL